MTETKTLYQYAVPRDQVSFIELNRNGDHHIYGIRNANEREVENLAETLKEKGYLADYGALQTCIDEEDGVIAAKQRWAHNNKTGLWEQQSRGYYHQGRKVPGPIDPETHMPTESYISFNASDEGVTVRQWCPVNEVVALETSESPQGIRLVMHNEGKLPSNDRVLLVNITFSDKEKEIVATSIDRHSDWASVKEERKLERWFNETAEDLGLVYPQEPSMRAGYIANIFGFAVTPQKTQAEKPVF